MFLQGIKKWPFSCLNFTGRFLDFFLAVLTDINLFLRFLYELSKSINFPKKKKSTCVEVVLPNVCAKCTQKPLVCLYLESWTLIFLGNLILLKAWYEDVAS